MGGGGEGEEGRGDVHYRCEGGCDGSRGVGGGVAVRGRKAGYAGHAHAAFGCVGFVQTAGGGGGLCPARTVPDEGVVGADVLEGVVVVLPQMGH